MSTPGDADWRRSVERNFDRIEKDLQRLHDRISSLKSDQTTDNVEFVKALERVAGDLRGISQALRELGINDFELDKKMNDALERIAVMETMLGVQGDMRPQQKPNLVDILKQYWYVFLMGGMTAIILGEKAVHLFSK